MRMYAVHYVLLLAVSKLALLLFCSTLSDCSLGGSGIGEPHSWVRHVDALEMPGKGFKSHPGMGFQKSRIVKSSWQWAESGMNSLGRRKKELPPFLLIQPCLTLPCSR